MVSGIASVESGRKKKLTGLHIIGIRAIIENMKFANLCLEYRKVRTEIRRSLAEWRKNEEYYRDIAEGTECRL